MTRLEAEMALLQKAKEVEAIVSLAAPNANHVHLMIIDGHITVSACEWDKEKDDYVEANILDASMYPDGTTYFYGKDKTEVA